MTQANTITTDTTTAIAEAYKQYLEQRMAALPEQPVVELSGSEQEIAAAMAARRQALRALVLGFPETRIAIESRTLERERTPTHRLEKVVFQSEPGSWVTALVYLPSKLDAPAPALVLGSGHGGGKGSLHNQVAAQIFAQLGLVVIVPDTIGEEDRFEPWGLGLRGHRKHFAVDRLNERGRPFIGKAVFDLSRALDYLLSRPDVDAQRVGCAGSSMGGTTTQLLIAADERFKLCVNSAWAADFKLLNVGHNHSKGCCWRLPGTLTLANQEDLFALAAPHCATLVMSGGIDEICPPAGLERMGDRLKAWWRQRGAPERFDCIIKPDAGHRQYHTTLPGLRWLRTHFAMDFALPESEDTDETIGLGQIVEAAGYKLQPLYDVDRHHRGTRTLNLPITIRKPESTAMLTDAALRECGLERDAFTLQGWLKHNEAGEIERVGVLPRSRVAYAGGLARYLDDLLRTAHEPLDAPLPARPTSSASGAGACDQWLIALDALKLRVVRPGEQARCETAVLHLPATRSCEAGPEIARRDALIAVPDLVSMNDEEMLLGETSTAFNLRLLTRCVRLLRERYDVKRIEIDSALPRLGELVCAADASLDALTITVPIAAEPSEHISFRIESVLPGFTRHFRWLDVFTAIAPRPMTLRRSYFDDAAREELEGVCRAAGAGERLRWIASD